MIRINCYLKLSIQSDITLFLHIQLFTKYFKALTTFLIVRNSNSTFYRFTGTRLDPVSQCCSGCPRGREPSPVQPVRPEIRFRIHFSGLQLKQPQRLVWGLGREPRGARRGRVGHFRGRRAEVSTRFGRSRRNWSTQRGHSAAVRRNHRDSVRRTDDVGKKWNADSSGRRFRLVVILTSSLWRHTYFIINFSH